jgi:DUF917 family protein
MKMLTAASIDYLAMGAAVLGTGGGGDPSLGRLMAKQALRERGEVTLLDPEELSDEALVIPSAMMGAPAVMLEKLPNGREPEEAFRSVEAYFGRKADAVLPIEAGGINSCIPVYTAARLRLPLVDADGMGRAFPEIQMTTLSIGGVKAWPMVCCDERGNKVIIEAISNSWVESISRAVTISMGLASMIGLYVVDGRTLKRWSVRGTITLAIEIGRRIMEAGRSKVNAVEAILEATGGFRLFEGKVTDVQRDLTTGFVRGRALFEGLDADRGGSFELHFQNENLLGLRNGEPCAIVPDLITVLDRETGRPITTEHLRYGQRVTIIGMPCSPIWRSQEGLALVGPRYFKYDLDYVPIEELAKRRGA